MTGWPGELLSLAALFVVLLVAVAVPRWEAIAAVPAAALVAGVGLVPIADVGQQLRELAPVVGFLVAVLVLAAGCDAAGLFQAAGAAVGRRSRGSPARLLAGGYAFAGLATIVLSLDTTVVLVTPVLLAAARSRRMAPEPVAYAAAHLANSASVLLPVSNLTNLLALAIVPIGFGRFAELMALPLVAVLAIEWCGSRLVFRQELRESGEPPTLGIPCMVGTACPQAGDPQHPAAPVFAIVVVGLTLVGFVVASAVGVAVAWPAGAGALILSIWVLRRRRTTVLSLAKSAQFPFAVFVLALGVVVRAATDGGLGDVLRDLLPHGASLPALLGIAVVAAVASNVLSNLPATLALLPLVAGAGIGPVLAVLIGADIGPNLTYPGSLATLLWRRQVGPMASVRRWTALGLVTVPAAVVLATTALWLGLRLLP